MRLAQFNYNLSGFGKSKHCLVIILLYFFTDDVVNDDIMPENGPDTKPEVKIAFIQLILG